MKILATIVRVFLGICVMVAGVVEGTDMVSGGKIMDKLSKLGEEDNKEEN